VKSRRLPWLLSALAATAALAAMGDPDSELAPPVAVRSAPERSPAIRGLLPRVASVSHGIDPFAVAPTLAPAEPPPASAVAPAPSFPPPLPWRVIGKQQDDAGWTVFLARGEDTQLVREGDTLDETYRVAAIQPPTLTLQHLKHKTRRTLDIGETIE